MKTCRTCNVLKSLDEFGTAMTRGKPTVRQHCDACMRAKDRLPANRFSNSKSQCKRDGVPWGLAYEDWLEVIANPCHYCQGPLPELGRGMDRIDATIGYQMGNVLPCCSVCNDIKGRVFTVAEMKLIGAVIRQIQEARKLAGLQPVRKRTSKGRASNEAGETKVVTVSREARRKRASV
jgi:hypothetical protein